VDMDISMDIHEKSVDTDMDMDVIFHIHGNPGNEPYLPLPSQPQMVLIYRPPEGWKTE